MMCLKDNIENNTGMYSLRILYSMLILLNGEKIMANWKNVKKEDVIKAIDKFNKETPDFTNPRSTYLVYDGIIYPAKQIRKMAHEVAFGIEPTEKEIYGGKPTIVFFENLGFDTYWTERDVSVPEYERQIAEMKSKKKAKNYR